MTLDWWATRWKEDRRLRFVVAGGWNTLFAYLAFFLLYAALSPAVHYLVVGVLAHALAIVNAFVVHRMLVFRSRGRLVAEFLRFNVAQAAVLVFGLGALWLLVSIGRLDPRVAQAILAVAAVVLSYLFHRFFTFADRS